MNSEDDILPAATRMTRLYKTAGWWFLLIGVIVSAYPLIILFDPQAAISIDGVPTKDFVTKVTVAGFVTFFPVLGAFLIFTPKKRMERWFTTFIRWSRALVFGPK